MNKKLLIALLTTLTAGSIIQAEVSSNDTENHGFLASLGIGVKDIVESPAHIGQGGKKKSKKSKSETESTEQQSKKKTNSTPKTTL